MPRQQQTKLRLPQGGTITYKQLMKTRRRLKYVLLTDHYDAAYLQSILWCQPDYWPLQRIYHIQDIHVRIHEGLVCWADNSARTLLMACSYLVAVESRERFVFDYPRATFLAHIRHDHVEFENTACKIKTTLEHHFRELARIGEGRAHMLPESHRPWRLIVDEEI